MNQFPRRATLALGGLLVCAGLVAAAPQAPRAPADGRPGIQRDAQHAASITIVPTPTLTAPEPARGAPAPAALKRTTRNPRFEALLLEEARDTTAAAAPAEAPAAQPPARPARIPGKGPLMRGELVAQTARLDVYVGKGTFDGDLVAEVAPALERMLLQDEQGFWPTRLDRRISIGFYSIGSAPSRGTRGMAYTADGRIEIYFRPGEDIRAAVTIASHELAHHLQYQRYGRSVQSRADTILHEGGATWIAGVRWLSEYDAPSWRGRAKALNDAGIPLVLVSAERYGADNAYELWASFVSFIVKRYGVEKYDELYASSRGRAPGSADYQGVLGASFKELQADWQEYIRSYVPPPPEPTATPEPTVAPTSQ